MTQVFGYFTSSDAFVYFPGAPFLVAGLLIVAAIFQFGRCMSRASVA